MVYPFSCIYNDMDVDDYMMCPYCNIEREELYMGGGLYCYKCPRCGSRMEVKQ
jgi:DNA-directed RNA polymerase subunit RPC12/RpoP